MGRDIGHKVVFGDSLGEMGRKEGAAPKIVVVASRLIWLSVIGWSLMFDADEADSFFFISIEDIK